MVVEREAIQNASAPRDGKDKEKKRHEKHTEGKPGEETYHTEPQKIEDDTTRTGLIGYCECPGKHTSPAGAALCGGDIQSY